MTNQTLDAPQEILSFDERIEILAKELELAVKWQRPCVLFVVYSSEYVRADVEAALENTLIDLGQKTVHLRIKNRETDDIIPFLKEFKDPAKAVFLIDGLRWGNGEETSVYSTLNLQKEFFIERQIRAIFWLTQNEIVELAHCAPDFWAYRHLVIEFVESPKAEQVLQQALESAWQGTGEYADQDQYEDTDAKISLRESLLTDLPEGEEASSTRANLLLTLGVLNWRKGDFEKADEQLGHALKIADKLEDGWFEAECYNAIALVKTSTERIDEAIDAYKQAIRLAPDQIFAWNNLGNLCAKINRNDEAMIAFRKAVECNPRDPIAWNGLATIHFKIGYVDDAIAAYRKAIQYMPTFAQPWNGLGDVYASIGRTDEALKAYQKAIELNKQYITPWIQLGVLYTKQERYREAIRAYQRALDLDARNSLLWNELGTIYVKSEDFDEAVEAFSKAIELDRGYGWAYSNLAFAYIQQGKYKKTVSLLLRSIDLLQNDKDKAVSWDRLANVYRYLNDYDNAIAAYQMADKLVPGSSLSKAADLTDTEEQLPSSGEIISEDPIEVLPQPAADVSTQSASDASQPAGADQQIADRENEPAEKMTNHKFMEAPAWIFNPAGIQEALEPNEKASEIQSIGNRSQETKGAAMTDSRTLDTPRSQGETPAQDQVSTRTALEDKKVSMDALQWNERGNACFNQGAFDEAINAYNKASQLDPSFGMPYSNLALTYLTQRQYAEAILLYQKSIGLLKSDKDKALSWNGLGNAYRCINDYANAFAAYHKAAELDPETAGMREGTDNFQTAQSPKNAQDWDDLGELFLKMGSFDEAVEAFQKAIDLEPETGKPYGNLAYTLVLQNRYKEAVPLYQKSINLLDDDKAKATAWNHLGNVYRKLNDYDNAIKAYQKAVVLSDEGVDLLTRTRFSLLSNLTVNQ
jgi:tetratricopeptide (TPR) repeat protein